MLKLCGLLQTGFDCKLFLQYLFLWPMHYCMGIPIKAFSTVIVGSLNSVLICTIYKITLNLSPLSYYISTEISHLYRKFSKTLRVFESPPCLHPIRDHHRDKCMFSMCLSCRDKYIFLHCILSVFRF